MRFMMFVHPAVGPEAKDWMPSPEAAAIMGRYNEELQRAGVLLDLAGLYPPAEGAAVRWNTGKPVVEDGPFGEAKEVVGGYWLIQAGSPEEAVEWAKRAPFGGDAWIEVRRVFEEDDFQAELGTGSGGVAGAA